MIRTEFECDHCHKKFDLVNGNAPKEEECTVLVKLSWQRTHQLYTPNANSKGICVCRECAVKVFHMPPYDREAKEMGLAAKPELTISEKIIDVLEHLGFQRAE